MSDILSRDEGFNLATELAAETAALRAQNAELSREVERLKGELNKSRLAEMRSYLASPAMKTFAELKHSNAGTVLAMLGDGAISRGKCCEALAQLAHGVSFDEIPLPTERGRQFAEDEIPAEVVEKLEAERDQWKARVVELERLLNDAFMLKGELLDRAEAAENEAGRGRERHGADELARQQRPSCPSER